MSRTIISISTILLTLAVISAPLGAQAWNPRDRDRRPTQPGTQQRPGTERGVPAAPTAQTTPENRLPIPPGEEAGEPTPVDGDGFYAAMQAAFPGIVHISMNNNRTAAGFIIKGNDEDKWFVVTNFRAIAAARWINIRFADGSRLEVEGLYSHDEPQDLALIQVKAVTNRRIRPLELNDRNPRPGEVVYAIGNPRDLFDWAATGKTEKIVDGPDVDAPFGSQWIQTEPVISANNIGGPLMAANGKVVGLLTSPGRVGRGPHLSVPVSKIREIMDAESFGLQPAPFPNVLGAFAWPEERPRRTETFAFARAQAAARAVQKNLECTRCEGHGVLITPIYRVDGSGVRTRTGEQSNPCDTCGGARIVIKTSIYELSTNLTRMMLNPDDKWTDEQKIRAKAMVEETFDLVAVNRKMLADVISPIASRILADFDRNRDTAVTFLAQVGPTMTFHGRNFQWVKPMDSQQWIATYGATLRTPSLPALPAGGPQRQRIEAQRRTAMRTNYILVTGIIRGSSVIESNKQVYLAPLLETTDLIMLRP